MKKQDNLNKGLAIFAGTFDPITLGHYQIALQALEVFEKVIVAIGENAEKKTRFSLEERLSFLRESFVTQPRIEIAHYQGTTIDFCLEKNAVFLIRGLRNAQDFENEKTLAWANQHLAKGIQTIFLMPAPETHWISSTLVREMLKYNKDVSALLPQNLTIV